MAKRGSADVGFFLVDGLNLLASDILSVDGPTKEAVTEQTDGLGKAWQEHRGTGLMKGMFSQDGYYDDDASSITDAFTGLQQTQRVVCIGLTGNVPGAKFTGWGGAFGAKYARSTKRGELHKAKVDYTVSGAVEDGIVLQELEAKTADWNTEGADSQDNTASSAAGGAGYLQINAYTGFTNIIAKIRHSADDLTYADLLTFATATAVGAQRVTVAGTVNRHLAMDGNITGSGSISVMVGFCRG